MSEDPRRELRRQVNQQNNAWLIQVAAFFVGGIVGLLFGVYVIMGIVMPGDGWGLLWTMVAGPCDMTANALFLVATRGGDLSVVAPLAALYPVTTVILALIIDQERLRGVQVAGLALAVAALVLVSG